MKARRKKRKLLRLNPLFDELKELEAEEEKAVVAQVDKGEDSADRNEHAALHLGNNEAKPM